MILKRAFFHSQSKYCLMEMTCAIYKISSYHTFTYCMFHVSLLLNILGYKTVIRNMREVQDYMDITTMKKSSNTWEIIFFQQMCILHLPNAKFYTLYRRRRGGRERHSGSPWGSYRLVNQKNMSVKKLLIIQYKSKDT